MEPVPVCPNCAAPLDPRQRRAIPGLIYHNVGCPNCGMLCVLEGPQANVAYRRRSQGMGSAGFEPAVFAV